MGEMVMAPQLEMRETDHVGASVCRNGRTFVHRVPSSTTAGHQDQILGNQSTESRPPHCYADKMSSHGERDTGAFLQHFTNSVSRALHKQTCTCNGRTYTADELRLKSNPAIFAPNFLEVFRRSNDPLPLINGPKSSRNAKEDLRSYTKPKVKSEYEFEPLQRKGNHSRKVKALGKAFPAKRPRIGRDVNLPERLDVVDKSGQNWQIVQDSPGKQHKRKTPERLRLLDRSRGIGMSLVTPPNSSRIERHDMSKSTLDVPIQPPNDCPQERDMDHSTLESEQPQMANYQTPTRTFLEFTESARPKPSVSRSMPDQNHKPTSMPDNRKGNIMYKDYQEMLASVTYNDDIMGISTGDPPSKETSSLTLPSLNTRFNSNTTHRNKLPPELERLYRGGFKLSTLRIDTEGTLPGDFLNRTKEELREMYPMYDWRLANGAREPRDRKGRNAPTIGGRGTSIAPSALELPEFPSVHQHTAPREKSRFIGKRQNRKGVRNEKSRNEVKRDLNKTGKGTTVLEQTGVGQQPEARPSSGLFPRQPPPTPMDGRRKRVADTQI